MLSNHSWQATSLGPGEQRLTGGPGELWSSSLWSRDGPRVGVTGKPVPFGYGLTSNTDEHLKNIHGKGVVTFPLGIPNPGTVLVSERIGFTKSCGF